MTRLTNTHLDAQTGMTPEAASAQVEATRPAAEQHRIKHLIRAVEAKMERIHEDNRYPTFPTELNLRYADLPCLLHALRAAMGLRPQTGGTNGEEVKQADPPPQAAGPPLRQDGAAPPRYPSGIHMIDVCASLVKYNRVHADHLALDGDEDGERESRDLADILAGMGAAIKAEADRADRAEAALRQGAAADLRPPSGAPNAKDEGRCKLSPAATLGAGPPLRLDTATESATRFLAEECAVEGASAEQVAREAIQHFAALNGWWHPDIPEERRVPLDAEWPEAPTAEPTLPTLRQTATKPCPFCAGTEFGTIDDDSPDDAFLFAAGAQATPPPGGWRECERVKCLRCHAWGPIGYSLNPDETAVLIGPTWDDRPGEDDIRDLLDADGVLYDRRGE